MTTPADSSRQGSSTRPYLIRALHDWCTDNGFTPYIAVFVDAKVQVPAEYVKDGEIVLNVGFEATSGLRLGDDLIEFKARFGGSARDILVPVDHVIAIYARENGQGMAFPAPTEARAASEGHALAGTPEVPGGAVAPSAVSAASRGLRLATPDEVPKVASHGPQPSGEPDGPPPEPGGTRPALKRVK